MNEPLRDDEREITPAEVRCPVCQARQPWSAVCRRCKCDLTLLREAAEAYFHLCRNCRESLRGNWPEEALEKARQAYAIYPAEESARLLAVCHFLMENWPAAAAIMHENR